MIAVPGLPADLTIYIAAISLGVFAVVVGVYLAAVPHPVEWRLATFVGGYGLTKSRSGIAARGAPPELLEGLNRRLLRRRQSASTRMLLLRANASMTVAELLLLRVAVALALGGIVALLLARTMGVAGLALAAVVALAGSYLPLSYIRIRASRRLAAMEAQLPDSIDLITSSLEAGGGMAQAFAMIAREMRPPMSEEFQRVNREVEVGLSHTEALANLVDRIGSEDLDLVVTTINIQAKVGGNLVQILRTINNTIRERIRIRGEVKVLTSQQRLSAYVISAIPPGMAVILFVINRPYISRLFQPGLTEIMLIVTVIMEVAGFLILQKIANIEY